MNTTCSIAQTPAARALVYKLRYACYHRSGAIPATPAESFSDRYDELPNHFSFLLNAQAEQAAATVRISVVAPDKGWTDCPSRCVFGDHPAFQEIAQGRFVEASRLCFGRQARRDAFYRVVAHLAALADAHGAQWVVACPREEHTGIYQRLFGFQQLAAPREYFGVNFKTSLLAISLEELRRRAEAFKSMRGAWEEALASAVATA